MNGDGAANVDGVRTTDTIQSEPDAICADCRWHRAGVVGSDWLRVRAAARRHVAGSGHVVLAGVRTAYLYAPDRRPAP